MFTSERDWPQADKNIHHLEELLHLQQNQISQAKLQDLMKKKNILFLFPPFGYLNAFFFLKKKSVYFLNEWPLI